MSDSPSFFLIDDEPDILEVVELAVRQYFPSSNISTFTNPQLALEKISAGARPNISIVDLNMPVMNGLSLAQKMLSMDSTLDIIIHSGILSEVEIVQNIQIGLKGMLEKPASPEQFHEEITKVLSKKKAIDNKYLDYNITLSLKHKIWDFDVYVAIGQSRIIKLFKKNDSIDQEKINKMLSKGEVRYLIHIDDFNTLNTSIYLPIDIKQASYIKITSCPIYIKRAGKIIRILQKGVSITPEHIKLLKKNNINEIYIEQDAFDNFYKNLCKDVELAINDKEKAREVRIDALLCMAEEKIQNSYNNPNEENISHIDALSNLIIKFYNDEKEAIVDILNINQSGDKKRHCINVATLSIAILNFLKDLSVKKDVNIKRLQVAKEFAINDNTKKVFTLAGLLHDLGENIKMSDTVEQATKGKFLDITLKRLSEIDCIPNKVLEMIEQHLERFDGSGPKKYFRPQINIYSQLFIICDQFDNYVNEGKSKQDAMQLMISNKNLYNETLLDILQELIFVT